MHPPIPVFQLVDGFATEEHPGGAAQFGIQLARHLDRQHFAPHVVGLWRYGTPSERRWLAQLTAEGIGTTILIDKRDRLAKDMLRAAARLRLVVGSSRSLVINSHFERGDLLGMWLKLRAAGDLKLVRTQHADQQWQQRPWLGKVLNLAAFPWLFDSEVAISATTRDVIDQRVAARLRGRRATLIYNGLSPDTMTELAAARGLVGLRNPAEPVLVIIGRLAVQKNHADALRALALVLKTYPQARLCVIGHGELRSRLEQLAAQLGITHATEFLGQRSDIATQLAQADLLVSSSIWEGFPTVVLEAMAAGVPVVATDVSGSRELVRSGETGRLVPMRDHTALAQAIIGMLDAPSKTASMAAQAQHNVQQHTFNIIAAQYAELYTRKQE